MSTGKIATWGLIALLTGSLAHADRARAQTAPRAGTTQPAPWARPLAAARRAYEAGRSAPAARLFARADALIGGYPYDDDEYDDEGQPTYPSAEARRVRASFQCAWALATLSASARPRSERGASAIARAMLWCDGPGQAAAALFSGDARQAALRLGAASRLPAPYAARPIPPEARAWAAEIAAGRFPPARDVDEALAFVRSHAAAQHGLATRCGPARGLALSRADERWPLPDEDEDVDPDHAAPAFRTGTPEPLAFVRCTYQEAESPYEEPTMGPGSGSTVYVLTRDASGVRIAGHFAGFWDYECWTGVVQGLLAHRAVALPNGGRLYAIERREGYVGYDDDQPSFVRDEVVLCDLRRGACRTLPFAVERTTVDHDADPPTVSRTRWSSGYAVQGDRLVLANVRGAPAALRRFGAGVPLDAFFREPPIDSGEQDLFPTRAVRAATANASCPWVVADSDGQTNVRAEPSTARAALGTVPNGATVTVAERRGRWWRIDAPLAGWVWAANLRQRCP
jgi:hypothetical protein